MKSAKSAVKSRTVDVEAIQKFREKLEELEKLRQKALSAVPWPNEKTEKKAVLGESDCKHKHAYLYRVVSPNSLFPSP